MDLKSCPFCGGKSEIYGPFVIDGNDLWKAGCKKCDIYTTVGPASTVRVRWNKTAMTTADAVVEVLMDFKKHTSSYPGNDYWSKRFEMAFENGCPCRFQPDGILTRRDSFSWCPLHGFEFTDR